MTICCRRAILESCRRPAIPYLGMYLTDLTLIHHGSRDFLDEDEPRESTQRVTNFAKCRKLYDICHIVELFQADGYEYTEDEDAAAVLGDLEHHSSDDLYDISLHVEPRGAVMEDLT